jgi:hypothetical protein
VNVSGEDKGTKRRKVVESRFLPSPAVHAISPQPSGLVSDVKICSFFDSPTGCSRVG